MNKDFRQFREIDEVKDKFINIGSLIGIVLGFLALLPPLIDSFKENNFSFQNFFDIISVSIIAFVYIFRKKINLKLKTIFIVFGLLLLIGYNALLYGIFSDNKILIIIVLYLIFLVFSRKITIWFSIIITIAYIIVAYFTLIGFINPIINQNLRPHTVDVWIIKYILFLIVGISIILLLEGFNNKFIELIRNLEQKNRDIKEKESKYTDIFNSVTDAIFIDDLKGNITDVNESMVKLFKYTKDELLNMDSRLLSQNYAPYDAEHYTNFVLQLNKKEKVVFEWHPKDKFGNLIWVEVTLVKVRIGGKSSVLTVIKNIDKQKKLNLELEEYRNDLEKKVKLRTQELQAINEELQSNNEELKILNENIEDQKNIIEEKEKRFHSIINNQGEGFGINDLNENFIMANKRAGEIFDVPEGKLTGMNLKDFFDDYEWKKIQEHSGLRVKNKKSSYETYIRTKKGEKKYLIVTGIPDYDKNGKIVGTIANFRDITDRILKEHKLKELNEEFETINEELNEANKELISQKNMLQDTLDKLKITQEQLIQSEKMASLGVLAAGVAHEINNPLNYIMGGITGLETLCKSQISENKEHVKPIMNAIKEGVKRAGDIVAGLNQFSRYSSSKKEECNIQSVIENCLTILNNKFKNKIEINRYYHEPPIHVVCNNGKIHQVILNILLNAEQSIEKKGFISVTSEINTKFVVITIEDSGCGIKKEEISKITDPFYTTKDPGKGTGLGLSIVNKIIEEHNGKIEFKSSIGKGTKVIIKLPKK